MNAKDINTKQLTRWDFHYCYIYHTFPWVPWPRPVISTRMEGNQLSLGGLGSHKWTNGGTVERTSQLFQRRNPGDFWFFDHQPPSFIFTSLLPKLCWELVYFWGDVLWPRFFASRQQRQLRQVDPSGLLLFKKPKAMVMPVNKPQINLKWSQMLRLRWPQLASEAKAFQIWKKVASNPGNTSHSQPTLEHFESWWALEWLTLCLQGIVFTGDVVKTPSAKRTLFPMAPRPRNATDSSPANCRAQRFRKKVTPSDCSRSTLRQGVLDESGRWTS